LGTEDEGADSIAESEVEASNLDSEGKASDADIDGQQSDSDSEGEEARLADHNDPGLRETTRESLMNLSRSTTRSGARW
jgi:hypothetical protein